MEIWQPIESYEGYYEVSTYGRVKSISRIVRNRYGLRLTPCIILTPSKRKSGYCMVFLCKNDVFNPLLVSRLVAKAFIPNTDNKPWVNHIDGNPSNNNVSNLEWCTPKENSQHAYRTGLMSRTQILDAVKKSTELSSKKVIQMKNGIIVNKFSSIREAGKVTGIESKNINKVVLGKRMSAGGFKWQYAS